VIDSPWSLIATSALRAALGDAIRGLRARGQRIVLGVYEPEHLPESPRPELLFVFGRSLSSPDRWHQWQPAAIDAVSLDAAWDACTAVDPSGHVMATVEVGAEA